MWIKFKDKTREEKETEREEGKKINSSKHI